jgi:nitrile hydratase accessory protein
VTARTPIIEDVDGPLAVPRANGELVFTRPWESSAFALALALEEHGIVDREEFRQALIAEIGEWERTPEHERRDWDYYSCWLRALESRVLARGVVSRAELAERAVALTEHDSHAH